MRKTNFAPPCGQGYPQTAVSHRSKTPLTNDSFPISAAHGSRTRFSAVLFLQVLLGFTVTLAIAGCGSTIAGTSSKPSAVGALSLSTSSLSFGSVTVGNSASETVVVTNAGSASLQVSQIQVSGPSFSVVGSANAPLTLAAGASSTLTVAFTPKGAGNAAGSLSVVTDNATDTIALTGNGTIAAAPGLTLSATSLAFGTVTMNTPVTQSVQITSSGTAPLTISGAMVSGSGFTMSNTGFPLSLSPGQMATLELTFDPKNSGQFTGAVTLNTNTSDGVATIALSGSGQPIQSLLNDFTCASDNVVGDGSENCSVALNSPVGPGGLTIGLDSSSTAVTVPTAVTIPEGTSSGLFTLSYSAVPKAQSVTLTASTTNSKKQHNLNLGASTPGLSLSPSAVTFGNVAVNSTSTQSVTLTSSGTSSLTISAATVSGAGYAVSGLALPVTLKAGQSAKLVVAFDPATTGSFSGTVMLTTNTSTGSAPIALTGAAQAAGTLGGLTCASSSMTAAGNDACTVSLTSAAPSGGVAVSLSSSSNSVAVPSSVLVPAGASTAAFTAIVSSVTTSQTATLTAQAGGITQSFPITLGASTPGLKLSATSLSFGSVNLNTPSSQSVVLTSSGTAPLTISAGAVTGGGFSISGLSLPLTLNPGQSASLAVQFDPTVSGGVTGAVTLTSNTSPANASIALSGTGQSGATLNGISCASASMTTAGNDACTISLTSAAPSGGLAVTLSSSSSAVAVPSSAVIPAGASSVGFTAAVSSVTTSQTATLTAQTGGVAKAYAISLGSGTPGLTIASTSLSFGSVSLNSPSTQSVLLTSSGTAPVTINAGSVTGTGFSISGLKFPLTLNPGATATLNIQFDPTASGAVTGTVVLTTNTSAGSASIALSGTGQGYQVDLNWSAPTSSTDPAVGYNVYRAVNGTSSYQRLNSAMNSSTSYADSAVVTGTTYLYYVTSVDAAGVESSPSNTWTAVIP